MSDVKNVYLLAVNPKNTFCCELYGAINELDLIMYTNVAHAAKTVTTETKKRMRIEIFLVLIVTYI